MGCKRRFEGVPGMYVMDGTYSGGFVEEPCLERDEEPIRSKLGLTPFGIRGESPDNWMLKGI